LIELWETFLLQMDAEEEDPVKGQPASNEAAALQPEPAGRSGGGPSGEEVGGRMATATDVALEQDA